MSTAAEVEHPGTPPAIVSAMSTASSKLMSPFRDVGFGTEVGLGGVETLKEFDVKKNGRSRKMSIELHHSGPDSRNIGERVGAYVRISKRKKFSIFKRGSRSKDRVHDGDYDSDDSDESSATSVGLPATHFNTNARSDIMSVPESQIISPSSVVSAVPSAHSVPENSFQPSSPSSSGTHSTRSLYCLDKVTILNVVNKRVDLKLEAKDSRTSKERIFLFHSSDDALSFERIIIQQKALQQKREDELLRERVEALDIKIERSKQDELITFLIEIVGAEDLVGKGITSSSDPYVVASFANQEIHRTQYISKSLNPVYTLRQNAFFLFETSFRQLFTDPNGITFIVYDFESLGRDEVLGAVNVPAQDLYTAHEERMVYDLHRTMRGIRTVGYDQGKIAIRCRRATDHDKEFLRKFNEYKTKRHTGVLLKENEDKNRNTRGTKGISAAKSIVEKKSRNIPDPNDSHHKLRQYKTVPYPDPSNEINTAWMTNEDIQRATMEPSRQYQFLGSGKAARVYLEILSCDNLPNMESMRFLGNKTDAFCKIVYEDNISQTDVIDDHNSPRWLPWTKRAFVLHTTHPSSVINIGVFDYDNGAAIISSHAFIGRASVDVTNLRPNTEYLLNYALFDTALKPERKSNGTIRIRLRIEVDDYRAYLLRSLKIPSNAYVNSNTIKDFDCIHKTCYGKYDKKQFSLGTILMLIHELADHARVYYYISDLTAALFLWRGTCEFSFRGKRWDIPLFSFGAFIMATTLVENPRLLPSYSFLTLGSMLLASMEWRTSHPNPWWRCHSFQELVLMLIKGKGGGTLSAESIEINQNAAEAKRFDQKWKDIIEEAQKAKAQRASDIAKEQQEHLKELEEIGGANAEIADTLGGGIGLPLLHPAKRFLYPMQQILVNVCESARFAKNVILWEESIYSFWLTFLSFMLSLIFYFIPWPFIIRWSARATAWILFGPWMKLVDIYVLNDGNGTNSGEDNEISPNSSNTNKRKEIMAKRILDTRIKNEDKFKLRDFKQYFFGKFLTKVLILKADRYIDVPLPSSTATPILDGGEGANVPQNQLAITAQGENIEAGQNLIGCMIPIVQDARQLNDSVPKKENSDRSDSSNVASLEIAAAVALSAVVTYFLVPFLISSFQATLRFAYGLFSKVVLKT